MILGKPAKSLEETDAMAADPKCGVILGAVSRLHEPHACADEVASLIRTRFPAVAPRP